MESFLAVNADSFSAPPRLRGLRPLHPLLGSGEGAGRKAEELGLRLPDRAESETFIDVNPKLLKHVNVIAFCGSLVQCYSGMKIACVEAFSKGRVVRMRGLNHLCGGQIAPDHERFLFVRKDT